MTRSSETCKEVGLIGGDDFTTSPWHHDLRYEPTLVCPFGVYSLVA